MATFNQPPLRGIVTKLDERSGVSAKTKKSWKVATYKLEEDEGEYPHSIIFEVFGEDKIEKFSLEDGNEYLISLDFEAHEYGGRWYNNIRAWKVETPTEEMGGNQVIMQNEGGSMTPVEKATTIMVGVAKSNEQGTGDLPF